MKTKAEWIVAALKMASQERWLSIVNEILNEPDTPKPLTIKDANPCPFCGGKMVLLENNLYCSNNSCHYITPYGNTIHEIVQIHNRVKLEDE